MVSKGLYKLFKMIILGHTIIGIFFRPFWKPFCISEFTENNQTYSKISLYSYSYKYSYIGSLLLLFFHLSTSYFIFLRANTVKLSNLMRNKSKSNRIETKSIESNSEYALNSRVSLYPNFIIKIKHIKFKQ